MLPAAMGLSSLARMLRRQFLMSDKRDVGLSPDLPSGLCSSALRMISPRGVVEVLPTLNPGHANPALKSTEPEESIPSPLALKRMTCESERTIRPVIP